MIISKTPVRISFFGGGTDYTEYFNEFGGCVLSTTIDKYVYITINEIGGLLDDKFRIAYRLLEQCNTIDEIQHPSVRETLRYMQIEKGLDINIFSDLPARTGLGSSSSFTVGLLNALYAYKGQIKSKLQLGTKAIHIEKDILCENVGVQDQLAAAFGGLNHMKLSQNGYEVNPIVISQARKQELEDSLVLYYTGISRFATEVLAEQVEKTKEKKIQVELKDIYDMVQMGQDILSTDSTSLVEFGKLLNTTWIAKKKLSTAISNSHLDEMYDLAMKSGAQGGKLLGAGGGGFFLFYVEAEKKAAFKKSMNKFVEIPFKFENDGTRIIHLS
jgi:D-glycero-alpha-D-manno-heptose-7-phosphate kinase